MGNRTVVETLPPQANSVSVIINTYNDADYLPDAIDSVLAQTIAPTEIVVVDDGSTVPPDEVLAAYPQVRLVSQPNSGLASARNRGLAEVNSEFVLFLDADDRLTPIAIEAGLACHARLPDVALVYGGHRRISVDGRSIGTDRFDAVGERPFLDLLRGNVIGMHASVLYSTRILCDAGGFDATLRRCEDYDLYLRLAQRYPIGCHAEIVAEYRWHDRNMSHDIAAMLSTVLRVHARYRVEEDADALDAWRDGQHNWRQYYGRELAAANSRPRSFSMLARRTVRVIARKIRKLGKLLVGKSDWPPAVGAVRLGHLSSTEPVSLRFGFDRGLPIDRYYIEGFLEQYASDIRGRVLEIGDATYSRRFGGKRVARQEILHVDERNPQATIVGDLTDPTLLERESFDCIVLTQTLHLIYDFHAAVESIHAALRPGGVALVTVPGVTPIDRDDWGSQWFWSFTEASARRLFTAAFGAEFVAVNQFGNVFAATTFLHGLAVGEVDRPKLDVIDRAYPVIVAIRAQKAGHRT